MMLLYIGLFSICSVYLFADQQELIKESETFSVP